MKKNCWLGGCMALMVGVLALPVTMAQLPDAAKQDPAVKRAQKQAKMLDTLYKTAIVLITQHYVDGSESLAAGDAFQTLFKSMKDNGFHEVRLLDATGNAYDSDNDPKTAFEKKAIKALLAGQPIVEEVVVEGDDRFLLSATPIPSRDGQMHALPQSLRRSQRPHRLAGLEDSNRVTVLGQQLICQTQSAEQGTFFDLMILHAAEDVAENTDGIHDVGSLVEHDALGADAHGGIGHLGSRGYAGLG